MLSWEARGSAPPPPRAVGRLCWEAASGCCSGCYRAAPQLPHTRLGIAQCHPEQRWRGGTWAAAQPEPGLWLQGRPFSPTVASGVGQDFGECSEVVVLCAFYHFVLRGLQATLVLPPKAEPGWCFSHGGKLNFEKAAHKLQKAGADLANGPLQSRAVGHAAGARLPQRGTPVQEQPCCEQLHAPRDVQSSPPPALTGPGLPQEQACLAL